MSSIEKNFREISQKISEALKKASRPVESAQLLVISKGQEKAALQALLDLGQHRFGENYAQEWREKSKSLASEAVEWHFVGRLQSNKLKYLIGEIQLFHSLDRWELAEKMEDLSEKRQVKTSTLIEVDLADQATKTGLNEAELPSFIEKLNSLHCVQLKGLMTFPPLAEDAENSRPYYRRLREILFELNRKNVYKEPLTELSMGMSNDYAVAAEEGATYLRVGRAMFKD